jgi:hypothetical protein
MLDGKKTYKVDRPRAEVVVYGLQSPTTHANSRAEKTVEPRSGKSSVRWKTRNVSVSAVDESAKPAMTALIASVRATEVMGQDCIVMVTTALDIEVTSRGVVGCMIRVLARRSITPIMCTTRNLISAGWVRELASW